RCLRERSGMIEGTRQGNDAFGRDFTVGRFQSDDAAGGRGDANRTAGAGAERGERHAGGYARRRASARAARRARRIERMTRRAEGRILVGRAERKLVKVGLADEYRAGLPQMRDCWRVALCDVAVTDP